MSNKKITITAMIISIAIWPFGEGSPTRAVPSSPSVRCHLELKFLVRTTSLFGLLRENFLFNYLHHRHIAIAESSLHVLQPLCCGQGNGSHVYSCVTKNLIGSNTLVQCNCNLFAACLKPLCVRRNINPKE